MNIKELIRDYFPNMPLEYPCIVRNMPNEIYHKQQGLSTSGIKTLLDCPLKYYYKYLSGKYEQEVKPHFKIGKAAHCLLLEGQEAFENIYWNNPYSDLKKDELVELIKMEYGYDDSIKKFLVKDLMEILLSNKGIEPKQEHLTTVEINQLMAMCEAIKNNPLANKAFGVEGESELSIFWQDKNTGLIFKCRPDFLPYDCENIPDYKTTTSVEPKTFYKTFINYGYHIQAAMYSWGIKELTGSKPKNFFFVAQEKTPPFVNQIFNPDKNLVEVWGMKAIVKAIEKYQTALKNNYWESYTSHVITLSLDNAPEDMTSDFDEETGILYAPKWIDKYLSE